MTNPLGQFFGQAPAAVAPPANTWLAPPATTQGAGPLGALAGLGTAPKSSGSGVTTGGLVGYLLLIVPSKAEYGIPKPGTKTGETQTKVIADVLVIRAPGGQTGQLTIACPGAPGEPVRMVTHHNGPDGQPDLARPFIHSPATGQFLSFPGMWIFGGALADGLLPCLDPNVPTRTMIATYIASKKGKSGFNYNHYADPQGDQAQNTGDWPEINAIAGAWLAQRSQSQFG